ncbi:cadherin-related family member 3-like [Misgurnus anguillicaudatus]|uniref:cadherin-related family member 3-like n=1 Tax=Misgurnus anguillicaudatus TaxID=75329 RepID=UPI003CCF0F06
MCLVFFSGVASAVVLVGLPVTVQVKENSAAGTEVFCFQVDLRSGASVVPGFPQILNSNPLTDDFTVFMVNSTHAQVVLTGATDLDFETSANQFSLQILVVDSDRKSDLNTLTVLITDVDEPPMFMDDTMFIYIEEKSPPKKIYQPVVHDPEEKPLMYHLIPSDPAFIIDSSTGSLFSTKPFDYITHPRSYSFNISVHDGNNLSFKQIFIFILNLIDDKPHFLNTETSFTLNEELSPGHVVANISAVTVVPDDSLYAGFIFYSISTNNYLTIQKYTGLVTIVTRMDMDSSPLRETPIINVIVTAGISPPGPQLSNSISLTFTVTDINDHAPVCEPDNHRLMSLKLLLYLQLAWEDIYLIN